MAAPKFNELNGVSLTETYTNRNGEKKVSITRFAYPDKNYSYQIDSTGDTMFMLDAEHNYDIVELIVKYITIYVGGYTYIRACKASDAEKMKNYIPYHYGASDKNREFAPYLIKFELRGSRSHGGLFFTSREEAEKWQAKLRNNECFVSLKKGDKIYVVENGVNIYEVEVNSIEEIYDGADSNYWNHHKFVIKTKDNGSIKLNNTRYEDKASDMLDSKFYPSLKLNGEECYEGIRLFMKKSEAEKAVADTAKRKQKSATVKYIKKMENHDGKPIAHHDNLGRELHYGDTVAYIRRTGYNAHPDIRMGVIVSESKTKITVLDDDEKKNGKPAGWRGDRIEETDGKHSVEPQSVLLMELVKVDKTSSYTFVKAK